MFDYTKASAAIISDDIKKYVKIFKNFSLVFTTCYFIFVIFTQTGVLAINITLALLFLMYSIFEFVTFTNDLKKIKKVVKKSYRAIMLSIKLFTLVAMIYGIYTATTDISAISILFAVLMVLFWVLQVFLELFVHVFENKFALFIAGYNKDMEDLKKPVTDLKKVVRRLKGEVIPPEPEKSKELVRLEKKIREIENEKIAQRNLQKGLQKKVIKPKKMLKQKPSKNNSDIKLLK